MAGVLASSPDDVTTKGCQTIPEGAQVQVLERYPSVFDLFRTVKVQVTTPAMPAPKIGYTIESVAGRQLRSGLPQNTFVHVDPRVQDRNKFGARQRVARRLNNRFVASRAPAFPTNYEKP